MAKVLKFQKKTPLIDGEDLFDLMVQSFGVQGAVSKVEDAMSQAMKHEQELFGDSDADDMSDEEIYIIFSDMPHAVKLAILRAG